MSKNQVKSITKKSVNISDWYNDVISAAKLADHGPVRGTMIIRPYAYAIWENIQRDLDIKIKDLRAQNAYFPLFIPYSFLKKEESHVEGFAPEVAVVTVAGGEKLAEPLVVRPTSETIMYDAFSRWISSYRDLPFVINQWSNVIRWEKRPYLFLRSTEFLWQEGHGAHATDEESQDTVMKALDMYVDTYQNLLSLWGYAGIKPDSEKFAGAKATYTYEMLLPDGKVLQGCTSHNLGQNFSKVFGVKFLNQKGQEEFVWQNSWGFSTRSLGGLIMVHGDDNGLVLPPRVAPLQIVIIPIVIKNSDKGRIHDWAQKVYLNLESHDFRVRIDNSDQSPGWKFNQFDLQGVPLRIEIGATEMRDQTIRVVRRDTKEAVDLKFEDLAVRMDEILEYMGKDLLEKSRNFTIENTKEVRNYPEFKEVMNTTRGFIKAYWCEDVHCEKVIKEETKATVRCLPLGSVESLGPCIYCNKPAKYEWLFGQSY